MQRRSFFHLLAGALALPSLPEIPAAVPRVVNKLRHYKHCDLRALIAIHELIDLRIEEDRTFIAAVDELVQEKTPYDGECVEEGSGHYIADRFHLRLNVIQNTSYPTT